MKTLSKLSPLIFLTLLSCSSNELITVDEWEEIDECYSGVLIDYLSSRKVHSAYEAGNIFEEYILYAKRNNLDIFGCGFYWRFDDAEKHGLYEGIRYWKIKASYYSKDQDKWISNEVFDVSEEGNVGRLLGCI